MAYELKNRVRGTTTTTGTGTYTIGAAPTGFQDFNNITSGREVYYCVLLGAEWEVGIGTVTVAGTTTLSRDTILESSNSNNAVNWPIGTKDVFVTPPAEMLSALSYDGSLRHGNFTGELKGGSPYVTGIVTPTSLSGVTDDWAPTLTNVSRIRLSCAASSEITGLAGGSDGKIIYLTNVGANTLIIRDEDTDSTAANRFSMNGDQLLPPNTTSAFIYDSSISRWSKIS